MIKKKNNTMKELRKKALEAKKKSKVTKPKIKSRHTETVMEEEKKEEENKKPQYDYKLIKKEPKLIDPAEIVEGTWLPVIVCELIAGMSGQMIRLLFFNNQVNAIRYKKGPTLFNLDEITEYLKMKKSGGRKVRKIKDLATKNNI